MEKALQIVLSDVNALFFAIDGIEACPKESIQGVLAFLKLLQSIPKIRILVTCQRTPEIMSAFDNATHLELDGRDNEGNIMQYVKLQLDTKPGLKAHFDYVNVNPFDYFRQNHGGMFLWVSTVLRYLQDVDSDADFESLLFSSVQKQ